MTDRDIDRVGRGELAAAATLSIAGLGLAVGSQLLVAAATLPLWYVAAAVLGTREQAILRVRRELSSNSGDEDGRSATSDEITTGDPGDTITVRTTVQNAGSEPIVDLRAVDGVPEELPVVAGTPRTCVTLDPLETATIEYEVELRRGDHAFDDPTIRTRDLTGTVTETWSADAAGDDAVRCSPVVETVPLGGGTNDYAGEVPTDEGSSGVEFYSVREYEPGDPVGAIDWRRYASTRDLATVEHRAERATRIVCVVDARDSQHRAATTARPPAIELSADAAERTVAALVAAGHPTGVVGVHENRLTTVPPGTDPTTRRQTSRLLDAIRGSERLGYWSPFRTATTNSIADIDRTLPGEAQVYLFSSFVDDESVALVERLRAQGYAVRVVSPDVTADADDAATRLAALDRGTRLARARAAGAGVIDWDRDQPLGLVLRTALGEVSRR
ncbi:DUF58 domain-containing protein [Natrinema salifodinae]|uniref:Conserved repeat domain-containing protein n=1 Tax=Natrinema salifodinae TaxID=1202768 RepID=A0A1I0Q3J9_9EURY|nr:DUF58 domain-containing protein [Natrinema salifodinae]SEW21470.1 conserved repeat domain-containing protein [Natrinema salifodinae]